MKTFLFYDVETSGLNPAFDQILTFASIRTDPDLKEIERTSLTIKLREDVIPSPQAFITHCLTGDDLEKGMNEYPAARRIHTLFNTPDTVSVGYNSLGFDDEFLRFLFYRNLLDPYSHQYANGCSRMDMLPVAALFRVFCESALSWPRLENGESSLKLELLTRENAFVTSGQAHEAMADVEALIELSKRLSREKKVWRYALNFFDREKDPARIAKIQPEFQVKGHGFKLGIIVSPAFGPRANYLAPVVHIGASFAYKNQDLWVRLDMEQEVDQETGKYDWFVIRKRPADQVIVLPRLDRFWDRLTRDSQQTALDRLESFRSRPDLFFDSIDYFKAFRYPFIPDIDPDADLYQSGFFSFAEKKEIARFTDTEDRKKPDLLFRIKSPRVRKLAGRILSRNFSEFARENPEFDSHLNQLKLGTGNAIKGYRDDSKITRAQVLEQIGKIDENRLDPDQKRAFAWVRKYIEDL
ncbi:exodeoxyribonuclease I [Desulfospira joergensenii]|uniref:exodeoxyribonuclease I n=1 Tax=Desulfospira joergensenii TaxID=53329 RepID=UPI0003B5FDF7|nr:exodeoxyribonuclease I [Desulfospira joergensenii]